MIIHTCKTQANTHAYTQAARARKHRHTDSKDVHTNTRAGTQNKKTNKNKKQLKKTQQQ